jgi:hypothetical protein
MTSLTTLTLSAGRFVGGLASSITRGENTGLRGGQFSRRVEAVKARLVALTKRSLCGSAHRVPVHDPLRTSIRLAVTDPGCMEKPSSQLLDAIGRAG